MVQETPAIGEKVDSFRNRGMLLTIRTYGDKLPGK